VFVSFRAATAIALLPLGSLVHFAIIHEHVLNVLFMARHGSFFALGIFLWLSSQRPLPPWERACIGIATLTCIKILLRSAEFLPHGYSFGAMLIPVALWVVLACFLFAEMQQWTPRIAATSLVGTLGLMTYPLYLIHNSLGTFAIKEAIAMHLWRIPALLFAFALMIAVSFVVVRAERLIRRGLTVPALLNELYSRKLLLDPFQWPGWTIYSPFRHNSQVDGSKNLADR
jgi:peptidoglycan/LPS O-acetylase OafA/YrhL